jgi:hypothetical protein
VKRIAVVAGAVICVVGLVSAGLAVASRQGGIAKQQAVSVAVQLVHEDAVDIGPTGDSPGDTFLAQSELRNFALTKKLGDYDSSCVLENLETRLNHCTATAFLPHGSVELSGRFNFTETLSGFRLAVIGGTGRYDNVVGEATITFGCDACPPDAHDVDTLTLDLIPSFEHP